MFSASFKLPANATYNIYVQYNSLVEIGIQQSVVVNPIDCSLFDANSVASKYGEECFCISGFGVTSTSGVYVTCTECTTGTYQDSISGTCISCEQGTYQNEPGNIYYLYIHICK